MKFSKITVASESEMLTYQYKKGIELLVGNIYCAHCGNHLTLTTSGRNKKMPNSTIQKEVRMRYQCHYNVRHPGECEG